MQAAQFCRGEAFVSARAVTAASGIGGLLPAGDTDEFVFEPCGYSMNGLHARSAFSTIHITPEEACSYASVELAGCTATDPAAFVAQVCPSVFCMQRLSCYLHASSIHLVDTVGEASS
jgi:hypothetical protein